VSNIARPSPAILVLCSKDKHINKQLKIQKQFHLYIISKTLFQIKNKMPISK